MIDDAVPQDFSYISNRLTTSIVQKWVAGKSRVRTEFNLTVGVGRLSLKVDEIDWNNPHLLARLATAAVEDETGWIDANDPRQRIPTGKYVRARMHLQRNSIPVFGWEEGHQRPIVGYVGSERLPDYGSVFVGLVGSHANLVEVQTKPTLTRAGRTASDLNGLYELIVATHEPQDGQAHPEARRLEYERAEINGVDSIALRLAADSFRGTYMRGMSEFVDVLFLVHRSGVNVDLQLRGEDGQPWPPFDTALLGAPVWVGTPRPAADERLLPSGRRAYQAMSRPAPDRAPVVRLPIAAPLEPGGSHLAAIGVRTPRPTDRSFIDVTGPALANPTAFDEFDTWLSDYVAVRDIDSAERNLARWPPTSPAAWTMFVAWALDQATRFANAPWPLLQRRSTSSWWGLRKDWDWDRNSTFGWIVDRDPKDPYHHFQHSSGHMTFALTTDGRIVRSDINGLIHSEASAEVEPDAPDAADACACLLRAVGRWRLPVEGGHGREEPDVNGSGRVYWRPTENMPPVS